MLGIFCDKKLFNLIWLSDFTRFEAVCVGSFAPKKPVTEQEEWGIFEYFQRDP